MTWRFMRINLEPQRQRFSLARCQPNKQRLDLVQRRWGLPKSSFPSPVSHPSIPDICYPLFPDGALSGAFSALVAIADGPKDRPATLVHLEIAPQSTLSSLPDFRGHAPVSEFPPSHARHRNGIAPESQSPVLSTGINASWSHLQEFDSPNQAGNLDSKQTNPSRAPQKQTTSAPHLEREAQKPPTKQCRRHVLQEGNRTCLHRSGGPFLACAGSCALWPDSVLSGR